jgi:type I restriction enzyme S subunit
MSWEYLKISEFADVITGGTPSTTKKEYWNNGTIPWLNSGELNQEIIIKYDNVITELGMANSAAKIMPKDTVLIALTGTTTGVVGYLTFDACANQSVTGILPSKKHHPKFLFYYLKSIREKVLSESYGGAQKHISQGYVRELEIPLPPLATQKRIAEILDAADALRRKDQVLLKKYDELAQGIFIDMFGDPVKNEMGWEVKKLKEICLKITDGTHFSPPNLPIGVPYITAKHLKQDVVDFYSNPTYISQKDHDEIFSRCTPEKGDVLYIKDGATTGIAAVNEYDFEFSMLSSLALIKPQKDKINSYYLSCYLNNKIVKQELIRCYMAGAAIKRFTLEKLNKFEIVVPHIELQNSFASRWIKLQESITSVKKSKATILFNSLIQKAFKGELVA